MTRKELVKVGVRRMLIEMKAAKECQDKQYYQYQCIECTCPVKHFSHNCKVCKGLQCHTLEHYDPHDISRIYKIVDDIAFAYEHIDDLDRLEDYYLRDQL